MVISDNVEVGNVDALMVGSVLMVGVSKSNSNDDGKLIDIEYEENSETNISENMGGLLDLPVSVRRCLSVESPESSIRKGTLGDMTLTSRIHCSEADEGETGDRLRIDRPKRTCCGWATVVVVVTTPKRRIEDEMEGVMNKKVMIGYRLVGVLLTLELCRIVRELGTHTPGCFP